MPGSDERGAEYSIQVSALADANQPGYLARVVVKELPGMREVFRDDVLPQEQTWPQLQEALAAALARGQQFVRFALCRRIAEGVEDDAAAWEAMLTGLAHRATAMTSPTEWRSAGGQSTWTQ